MKWTAEQQKAIDLRGKNILVAAAAGSGKTSVLVERIRKMVSEDGIPIRSFLVVTFTNAAAAEMKERLRTALRAELDTVISASDWVGSSNRVKYLKQQLTDLETANISTFHSFGLSVIRRFFYKLDIEPGFATADETEIAIMKEQAMDELLDREFAEYSEDFIAFMDAYSGDRSNYAIRNLILGAYTKLNSMPHAYDWMDEQITEIEGLQDLDSDSTKRIMGLIESDIKSKLISANNMYEKAAAMLDGCGLEYLGEQLRENEIKSISDAIDNINDIENKNLGARDNPTDRLEIISEIIPKTFSRLTAKKEDKPIYEAAKETVKKLRDEGKKYIQTIRKSYLEEDVATLMEVTGETAPYLRTLLKLVQEFDDIYSGIKADQGVIDFDDIEHCTLELLEDDQVADYYRDTVKYIFVDEYQDTNLMQEAIINRISGENNLFMVGDVKQSIYRFRLAEPSIFQEKYDLYSSGSDLNSVAIDLNENHRSKGPIIDYINRAFEPLMKGYDDRAKLYAGVDYTGPLNREPELRVIVPSEGSFSDGISPGGSSPDGGSPDFGFADGPFTDDDYNDNIDYYDYKEGENGELPKQDAEVLTEVELTVMEQEAHYIAGLIRDSLGTKFYDSKMNPPGERTLTAGDIVILRRSIVGCQDTYQKVLKEYGIQSHIEGDDGYFDSMEISGFLDLLQVIDNLRRDVSLIGALHSEVFGFTAEDLARIRIAHKEGTFADAFLDVAGAAEFDAATDMVGEVNSTSAPKTEIHAKSRDAYEKILLWRDMSRTMTLPNFIWRTLIESGYYVVMGALPDGGRRQANLRMLCDLAEKFSSSSQGTLYDFLKYIEAIKSGKIKMPEARISSDSGGISGADSDDNSMGVRIMTVHKSKGLEFPMVIVSGLGRKIAKSDAAGFSMHKDIGVGLKLVNREEHWSRKTLMQDLIGAKSQEEDLEEEIRILYVAMTRARDRLYLIAHQKNDNFARMAELGVVDYTKFLGMVAPSLGYSIDDVGGTSYQNVEGANSDGANADEAIEEPNASETESFDSKKILSVLNYKYPHEGARKLKSKYSVSELNREYIGEHAEEHAKEHSGASSREDAYKPALTYVSSRQEPKEYANEVANFTAAERGTIYHKILESLEFASFSEYISDNTHDNTHNNTDGNNIANQILEELQLKAQSMVDSGLLSKAELAGIDLKKIQNFFLSDIGRRCIRADAKGLLEKERPFTLKIEKDGEEILVQGIIDCYFREPVDDKTPIVSRDFEWIDSKGNAVCDNTDNENNIEYNTILLDYKSNWIDRNKPIEEEEDRLRHEYQGQLDIYRTALEKAGMGRVCEVYLYLLDIGHGFLV